jgi:hypothetical protein
VVVFKVSRFLTCPDRPAMPLNAWIPLFPPRVFHWLCLRYCSPTNESLTKYDLDVKYPQGAANAVEMTPPFIKIKKAAQPLQAEPQHFIHWFLHRNS